MTVLIAILFLIPTGYGKDSKSLFISKCVMCHNVNPTKPGSIGPAISGSSLELIKLKTQKRQYPKGYVPKRKTKVMPIVKLTEQEIKLIHSYLNSFIK
jgi:mono/diheme cytochrome c family protein